MSASSSSLHFSIISRLRPHKASTSILKKYIYLFLFRIRFSFGNILLFYFLSVHFGCAMLFLGTKHTECTVAWLDFMLLHVRALCLITWQFPYYFFPPLSLSSSSTTTFFFIRLSEVLGVCAHSTPIAGVPDEFLSACVFLSFGDLRCGSH